jgi:hypothetical protein
VLFCLVGRLERPGNRGLGVPRPRLHKPHPPGINGLPILYRLILRDDLDIFKRRIFNE